METVNPTIVKRSIRINDFNESGKLLTYTMKNFKLLPKKDTLNYHGLCSLEVKVGDNEPMLYTGVKVSPLLTYRIGIEPEKYLNVSFTSYNTSMEFNENPFRFEISADKQSYWLNLVFEKGTKDVDVMMPDGSIITAKPFVRWRKDQFLRFVQRRPKQ